MPLFRRRKNTEPEPEPKGTDRSRDRERDRERDRPALASSSRPISEYLAPAGRFIFWLAVLVVIVRGVGAILSTDDSPTRIGDLQTRVQRVEARDTSWPDASAETFAVQFARVYLGYEAGDDTDAHNAAVARFYAPGVSDDQSAEQTLPAKASQTFLDAQVARSTNTDNDHSAITVAAYVEQRAPRGGGKRGIATTLQTIYLTVPVGRDAAGRVAVYGAPSLAPPLPLGRPKVPESASVKDPGSGEITDVTRRFLAAYLAGKPAGDLSYFLANGTTVDQFNGEYTIANGAPEIRQFGNGAGSTRTVTASVAARDNATGATYNLSYQFTLIRRDRWQIRSMVGNPQPPRG